MSIMRQKKSRPVTDGALAGSVLAGCRPNNQGRRLHVEQDQTRSDGGPLQGRFVIVDAGINVHTDQVAMVLHRSMVAGEVLALIRQHHPSCVNIINANGLTLVNPLSALAPAEG